MVDCKAAPTPFVSSQKLLTHAGDLLSDPTSYRSLVGALQYATFTWPDITFAVNHACQFMHAPTSLHLTTAKRILCYLKGSLDLGIFFQPVHCILQPSLMPIGLVTQMTDALLLVLLSFSVIIPLLGFLRSNTQYLVLLLRLSIALYLLGLLSLLGFVKYSVIWVYFFPRPL